MHAIRSVHRTKAHEALAKAAAQHGVVARAQLLACGLTPSMIKRWVDGGRLYPRHRGVYATTPVLQRLGEIMAAVLAYGPGAAASHQSAGHLHELRRHEWGPVHVTVPRSGARSMPGTHVHVCATLTAVGVQGIPTTTVVRTLTDLADVLTPSALQLAVSTAERKRLIDRDTYRPLPGRRAVMDRPHLFTRSQNERALFALCERHGFPLPLVNQAVDGWEVDFLWPGLALELDAWHTHGDPVTFERDRMKDEHLELRSGLMVRRVTDVRLHERPDEVAAVIARALEAVARR